jgi:cytochrome c peroxidase
MHDGSIESLEEVVRVMTKYQLGKPVTDQQVADMVAFMKLLTGKLPTEYIKEPALPGMS